MLSSPSLFELLQSTVSPPDATSDFSSAMRELRMAEADLRFAVEVVEHARAPGDRSRALHLRDEAMRGLIVALQRLQIALQDTP
jgi:hypothetical protein